MQGHVDDDDAVRLPTGAEGVVSLQRQFGHDQRRLAHVRFAVPRMWEVAADHHARE